MGEDVDEDIGVGVLQAVPQVLQHGQHDVQDVAHVQRDQNVAEAVPSLGNAASMQLHFYNVFMAGNKFSSKGEAQTKQLEGGMGVASKKVWICFFPLTPSQKLTHPKLTSLLANMATDTRLPAMPKLPMRRVAANVMWENRVKIAILASWCDDN